MKKVIFFFLVFCIVSFFSACKHQVKEKSFTDELTQQDSLEVLHLGDSCMSLLKERKFDEALDMIYYLRDSITAIPMDSTQRTALKKIFKHHPVYKYELDYFNFSKQDLNDIKYRVQFFQLDGPNDHRPNTIGFMFNPVKIDGTWKLTMKNAWQSSKEQMKANSFTEY